MNLLPQIKAALGAALVAGDGRLIAGVASREIEAIAGRQWGDAWDAAVKAGESLDLQEFQKQSGLPIAEAAQLLDYVNAGGLDLASVLRALRTRVNQRKAFNLVPQLQTDLAEGRSTQILQMIEKLVGKAGDGTPPEVLAPGAHVDQEAKYQEIGNDDFADAVLSGIPAGVIYRRSGVAGEIVGDPGKREFRPLSNARLRVIVDQHVRICAWKTKRVDGGEQQVKVYVPCSRDHAAVVLDQAAIHPVVRDLRMLTVFPCFLGRDFRLIAPGWNPEHGAFYDQPPELEGLDTQVDLNTCYGRLQDLVIDFPWKDEASKENFLGLLLTPLVRNALDGNVPMHLILSPLERTGKSKLAEEVFGGVILGRPTPALQMTGTDEERDKRITGLLLEGSSIVHIDNVREYLDSAALASLLTATTYSGRLLGRSEILRLPNNMTVVASGNNVRATGEIVKRTIPVVLQPKTDQPEARTDFRHPDLREYVREVRRDVLSSLLSMIVAWKNGERILHPEAMGGFERWSQVVGGVLITGGFGHWMDNARAWRISANPEAEELRLFVNEWAEKYGESHVLPSVLLALAEGLGLFNHALRAASEKARQSAFGKQVLARHLDSPVGLWFIRMHHQGNQKFFYLEPQQ